MRNIESKTLENGFKVIYTEDHSNPLVSLHIFVRMGSGWEEEHEAGFSHFAEHLVFKGTRSYPQGEIMDRVSFLGGSINAYTEYDSTCYYLSLPSKYLAEGLKILTELVRFSVFDEEDFNAEKQVILEEIAEVDNDPEESLVEKVISSFLPENPYRKSISGKREAIEKAEFQQLKDFIKKYYAPQNCFLVCSGDFEKGEIDRELQTLLSGWKSGEALKRIPYKDGFYNSFEFEKFDHQSNSDMIAIAICDLSESDPDSFPLNMVYKELFSDSRSLLYKELFNNRQLIDGMRMHSITGINDGVSILVIFPRDNVEPVEILKVVYATIEGFRMRGISAHQLLRNQSELLNAFKYSFEYNESLAACLGAEEITQNYSNFLEYPDKVKNITRMQVREMLDKWLQNRLIRVYYQGKKEVDATEIKAIFNGKKKSKRKGREEDLVSYKLPNGIEVMLKRVSGKPVMGFTASFDVSQLNERKGNRGINQITSGLTLYGSGKMSYEQINEFSALHGISLRTAQRPEMTSFIGKCFQEDLPLALHTFADVIFAPKFPREYFINLRNAHVSMIKRVADYPSNYAGYLYARMFFGKNSLFIDKEGTRSDLNRLTLAKIRNWHKENYVPGKMKFALAGDVDFDYSIKLIESIFTEPKHDFPQALPDYSINPSEKKYHVKDTGLSQAFIVIGGNAPDYKNSHDKIAMVLLSLIIGGDVNSILFQELREKHGLAYSVEMNYQPYREFGYYVVSVIVERNNDKKAISIIREVLKEVSRNGVSAKDLEKAKNHLLGQLIQEQQSMSSVSQNIAICMRMGWGYKHYLTRKERLLSVTLEDVKRVANEVFNEEDQYIQVLK